jgi:hypothetical protein
MSRIALVLLAGVVCSFGPGKCGYHPPPEYRRIFDLPSDQQEEEFKKFPLDKQVDMYRYAMSREPPDMKYVDFLASNGKWAIPYLLGRLQGEESDYFKSDLILVFRTMHQEYYNLRNESEVIQRLRQESARIRDSFWREESEKYIKAIVEEPGVTNN